MIDKYIAAVTIGMSMPDAATTAGVTSASINGWLREARAELHRRSEGLDPDDSEWMEMKLQLLERRNAAQTVLKQRCLTTWNRHASTDWRAARELLISKFPGEFAPGRDLVKAIETRKQVDQASATLFLELVERMIDWTATRYSLDTDQVMELREAFADIGQQALSNAV